MKWKDLDTSLGALVPYNNCWNMEAVPSTDHSMIFLTLLLSMCQSCPGYSHEVSTPIVPPVPSPGLPVWPHTKQQHLSGQRTPETG